MIISPYIKRCLVALLLLTTLAAQAADDTDGVLAKYRRLPPGQLIDTANLYSEKREFDVALICYSLVADAPEVDEKNLEMQKLKIDALNKSAIIYYYWMSDYVKAYQLLAEALALCEIRPGIYDEFKIWANIGNIYYYLDEFDTAGQYYRKALALGPDSISVLRLHNNISTAMIETEEFDEALEHIEKSLDISRRWDSANIYSIQHTAASLDQKRGLFDSAMRNFLQVLDDARKNGKIEYESEILSGLGKLSFEMGRPAEAEQYIAASNAIADENNLNNILLENQLLLARIGDSRGRYKDALEHLKRHNSLRDSLFGTDKLATITQLRRIGEVSKINREIEQMAMEQRVKERTISYQKMTLLIAFVALVSMAAFLIFVFRQKRALNRAYHALVKKNIAIMKMHDGSARKQLKNVPLNAPHDDYGELLNRVFAVMEDTQVICNPDFSINTLALLTKTNNTYVSQAINSTLQKNFRALLNEYRIMEAQRLFSRGDAAKYTIESISLQLGYKSPNTFRAAFQEITGVSPSFYLNSMDVPASWKNEDDGERE